MKFLKEYAFGLGVVLLVSGLILETVVPERQVYDLSVAGFGLVLAVLGAALNRERILLMLKGRRARAAGASVSYVLTVLAVVVLVNFLAGRHHKRLDLTENQAFSLSEQTDKVLEALPRDVTLTAFVQGDSPTKQKLSDLLEEYKARSSRFKYEFVDPDTHPAEAKRYGITEYGTIVIESGKQESRTTTPDEESLTNALIKVTRDREVTAYFTTGHGERDLKDTQRAGLTLLKEALEKQHYAVKPLVLNQGVPADASLVVIAGPQKPFLEAEARMVKDYLDKGGRVFFMQDPDTDPGLKSLLASYGVEVRKDVVIDKISQLFGGDALIPMVPADGYDEFHPITKSFRYQTFYPLASSIAIQDKLPDGVSATKLAQTSQYSWGETNEAEIRSHRVTLDPGADTKGPLTLAAAITRRPPAPVDPAKPQSKSAPETRLLVFGDSDFLTNASFNAAGNGDLALNAVAWLSEQEDLVSIRPKTSVPRVVVLSPQQAFYYFWTIVALAPVIITAVGVVIWVRRKKL